MDIDERQVVAIRNLTKELPLNDFGFPVGIYRTDMLPWHEYEPNPTLRNVALQITHEPETLEKLDGQTSRETKEAREEHETQDESTREEQEEIIGWVDELLDPAVEKVVALFPDKISLEPKKPAEESYIAGFPTKSLERAFMWLSYDEGFPTFVDGSTFWSQLEFESPKAHSVFQRYLQMHQGTEGDEDDAEEPGESASGVRSINDLAGSLHGDTELLGAISEYTSYYHLYYWGLRAKAYDIFRIAAHRKKQEIRALETEDSHFITSKRLMHKLMKYMDDEENFWDMMTPKIGIDMLKMLTQLQRISSGLPGVGPAIESSSGASLEVAFRSVAQESNITRVNESGDVSGLQDVLSDPEKTKVLQELIISIKGGGSHG